jgi:hypothetical protein
MENAVLRKTASNGAEIEVRIKAYLPGLHIAQLYINGQYITGPEHPTKLQSPRGEVTHFLGGGFTAKKQAVGLTTAEAEKIEAAIEAANEAWRASDEGRLASLRNERERLVAEWQGLLEEAGAQFEALHAREETDAAWTAKQRMEALAEESRRRLAAFDAANPGIREK